MTTLSVPIDSDLEAFIADMISSHKAENKAQVVRRALYKMREDEAMERILSSRKDIKNGDVYSGDLNTLLSGIDG